MHYIRLRVSRESASLTSRHVRFGEQLRHQSGNRGLRSPAGQVLISSFQQPQATLYFSIFHSYEPHRWAGLPSASFRGAVLLGQKGSFFYLSVLMGCLGACKVRAWVPASSNANQQEFTRAHPTGVSSSQWSSHMSKHWRQPDMRLPLLYLLPPSHNLPSRRSSHRRWKTPTFPPSPSHRSKPCRAA